MQADDLRAAIGGIDIMLLDQIQRGRIADQARVFDAGCGGGRNLHWFVQAGHPAAGCDSDAQAIAMARAQLGSGVDLRCEDILACSAKPHAWDLVICNAVIHFSRDADRAAALLDRLWELLAVDGLLFTRLATKIGLPENVHPAGFTFLPDLDWLLAQTRRLGGTLVDPIKTSNVQNQRCMSTWVLRKA